MLLRVVKAVYRRIGKKTHLTEVECVTAVRDYIRRNYPRPSAKAVARIVTRAGFDQLPLPLLVAGSTLDASPGGAFARLSDALDPDSSRFTDPHTLFSTAFYLLTNPDVAEIEATPWAHYQAFGVLEGRSPHPLLDQRLMHEWLPSIDRKTVVDRYLSDPSFWTIDTSPYVDSQRYLLDAGPNLTVPPIMRILDGGVFSEWVSLQLMLIDAGSTNNRTARLNAAAFLVTVHTRPGISGRLVEWSESFNGIARRDQEAVKLEYTVVPGYFLGADGTSVLPSGPGAVSADSSVVRLPNGYLSFARGPEIVCDRLVYVTSGVSHTEATSALVGSEGRVVIAPHTGRQATAFRGLAARLGIPDVIVLPAGEQASVRPRTVVLLEGGHSAVAPWRWDETIAPSEVIFLLPPGLATVPRPTVKRVLEWVAAGSSALTIDDAFVSGGILDFGRPCVVIDSSATELARVLVDDTSLWTIEPESLS